MKCHMLLALLVGLSLSSASAGAPSPVSRVAQLLQDLSQKIDSELDAETDLYEKYVCWAKTVVSSKTLSNEKAQTRVDTLKTWLADLAAGRIELTTERADLEKEVGTLSDNLETAKALRMKQNDDFKAATSEMDQAITALKAGIKVLDDATKDSKSALVSLRASISQKALESSNEGFSTRVAEADALQRAVDVGSRYLKAGDAVFLQRLLTGDVPQVDWKKLNRKATFKMKYKARSVKIQDTLAKLLQSFEDNKADAEKTEKAAKETYEKLKKSKEEQLKAAQDALTKQEVEGGAAAVSKEDADNEIKALEKQIEDDKKYISETEDALKDKKQEFVTRKGLRVGEMKAISEAISVIHSDDARDLFKRAVNFLQVSSVVTTATARASATLQDTAHTTGDLRLSALASRIALHTGGKFDKVIGAIDKMISLLEQEDKDDQKDAGECEKDREANTKEAAELSRKIDELSDDVSKLQGEIKEIEAEVEEKEAEVKDIQKEVKDAKRIRADENAEWKQSDADDTAAIKLLAKSADVLKTFYKENFNLLQTSKRDPPVVEAGEEPPPPPKTWDGDYGGAQKESQGIVGILDLIKSDLKKDQDEAKKAEDKAQSEHDKFLETSKTNINNLNDSINSLNESKASKEKDISSKESESKNKKGSLDTVVDKMKKAAPGCDFMLVNLKVRADNRKLELKGLNKAKEILQKQNK